jgi:hypothetical protein
MHKQFIKAKLIESLPVGVKQVPTKHKFFHASLLAGLKFYEDETGLNYVVFFNSIVFVLSRGSDINMVESKLEK